MKKVKNPFLSLNKYNCFACSPYNENGLKLEFYYLEDEVISTFTLDNRFEGFPGIVHGGIISTVHDEVMYWIVFELTGKIPVTGSLSVKFKLPLTLNKKFTAKAKKIKDRKKLILCTSEITDENGLLYSTAEGIYVLPKKDSFSKQTDMDLFNGPLSEYFF